MSEKKELTLDQIREAILIWCDGVDAVTTQLRKNLAAEPFKPMQVPKANAQLPFDASKIMWKTRQGDRGEFQLSEDINDPNHKALLEFLVDAGGRINSDGYFYWVFVNGTTIGRKQQRRR